MDIILFNLCWLEFEVLYTYHSCISFGQTLCGLLPMIWFLNICMENPREIPEVGSPPPPLPFYYLSHFLHQLQTSITQYFVMLEQFLRPVLKTRRHDRSACTFRPSHWFCFLVLNYFISAVIWLTISKLKEEHIRKLLPGHLNECSDWNEILTQSRSIEYTRALYSIFSTVHHIIFGICSISQYSRGRRIGPLRVPLLWSLVNSDLLRVSFIYKLQENGSTTKPTSKNWKLILTD